MKYKPKFLSWAKSYKEEVKELEELIESEPSDVALLKKEYEQLTGKKYMKKKVTKKRNNPVRPKAPKATFRNADYWHSMDTDERYDDLDEALELARTGEDIVGVHSKLLLDDRNGIYIPKIFCENFNLSEWSLSEDDSDVQACLAGPDEEWYWEAWNNIMSNARYVDANGDEWYLEQEGDLFAFHNSPYAKGDEDDIFSENPRDKEVDEILVRDVYLTLSNESDFYQNYLLPLYRSAEKFYKKGQYNSKNFINALQKGINDYTLHGPIHFSYNRKFASLIPKHEREAVAKEFEEYFLGELELGNSWLLKSGNPRPRKFKDVYVIVGYSSYGKEDIDEFDTMSEARKMIIEYRMAMPTYSLKIVKRKEPLNYIGE